MNLYKVQEKSSVIDESIYIYIYIYIYILN